MAGADTQEISKLMAAMKKVGSDEALRETFNILSKSSNHVSADLIEDAMSILGVKVPKDKINEIIREKIKVENDKMIDRDHFIIIMKNIWKSVADRMINDVEKVFNEFIQTKAEREDTHEKFINILKKIWKRLADSKIDEVETKIGEFISKKDEKEKDGNARREFIDSLKDISKSVPDSMIHKLASETDEFVPNKAGLENNGTIHIWFNSLKHLWRREVDSMIKELEKAIDEFIMNKSELENKGNIRDEFISKLKDIKEKVGSEKVLKMAHVVVLAEKMDPIISVTLFRRLIQFMGCNLEDKEIIENIKKVKNDVDDDGQINREELIQIIRDIEEKVGSEKVLKMAHAVVLAEKLDPIISATLLRRLIPFLGGNLEDKEIIENIKKVKNNVDDDGQINREEFIQIIRSIWEKSSNLLSKAMGEDADSEEARAKAFGVLRNPLDDSVSATILFPVLLNLRENLDFEELYRTIHEVKANLNDELIKSEGFLDIIDYVECLIEKYPLDKIYGVLSRKRTRRLVLSGESGVGKTWMATKIAGRATKEEIFDFALWVNLKGLNLSKIIAHQLSLLSASDEMETEKVKEVLGGDKKKFKSLKERIHDALKKKVVLLIFDGVNSCEELEKDLSEGSQLHKLLNLNELNYKVLITASVFGKFKQQKGIRIKVRRWTNQESESFLSNYIGDNDRFSEVRDLAKFYIERSKGLPAEILFIAKTLSHFMNSAAGLQKLQGVKEVVLKDVDHDYNDYRNIEKLFISTEVVPKIVLVDCYSSETPAEHFLNERGSVHYNELISYWILEGHLGPFSCIEDAYAEGHRVLMELLDCGLLKPLKAGYVKSNGAKFEFSAQDYYDLYQNNRLGLATTFDNRLGNTVLGDGMIRTFPSDKEKEKRKEEEVKNEEEDKMSTLLLDGDRTGEVSDNLFDSMEDLKILAIFGPTHKPFPLLTDKWNLRFLVLRGCEFLTNFDQIFQPFPLTLEKPPLEAPTVLEISGPSSLKEIPKYLFDVMINLKSLNMSSLKMEYLPESFYSLTAIEILILKDCSSLKRMESVKKFKKLQLLDLSGATSLEAFKDKSFSENKELQMINLSQSRIAKFPLVHDLKKLKYLTLSKCPALIRVRRIGSVETLRVFDISGSKNVDLLLDPGLEKLKNLFALNVSGTAIRRLPSTIGTPRHLHLSDCFNLKQLPPIETLSEVRVLDLSGSALLDDVKPEFIQSLINLERFNLSKTGVVHLPSLSSLVNLRCLLLSQCQRLEKLEGLGSLTNLEVLDLSGCKALSEIEEKSFDEMGRLDSLDLSETPLEKLPSLSSLLKLKRLNLRGCTKLTNIPDLEGLTALEDLDISRTTVETNLNCRRIVRGPKPSRSQNIDLIEIQKYQKYLGVEQHEEASGKTKVDCDDKTTLTQEEMDQCYHWCILNRLASHNSKTNDQHVIDAHFRQLLKTSPDSIKKFNFIVYPMEEAAHQPIKDKDLLRNESVLRKILLGHDFPEADERCLEIRGFRDSPKFLGQLLERADMMVLIDNSCIRFLSDLGADNLNNLKVCWIETCNEMEYVTDEANESTDILTRNINILWVSEAAKLKSICKETSRGNGFSSLTSLYLEYCPELSNLCFSCKQLTGLKILHVKYCQKFLELFDETSAQLPNLQTLHLWALPALKEISCGMQSLLTLTVGQCPLLECIFDTDNISPTDLQTPQFSENVKTVLPVGLLPDEAATIDIIILNCPKLRVNHGFLNHRRPGIHETVEK